MPHAQIPYEPAWRVITHLGAASVMLPMLAVTATDLWRAKQHRVVKVWLEVLAVGVILTVASKVVFLGFGLGVAALDFTGASGHTLLATAVLPVAFRWLFTNDQGRGRMGAAVGLLLGAGVGVSRVVLSAHSISEAVVGWLLGVVIAGTALRAMNNVQERPMLARVAPLVLLLAFGTATSTYLPTHDWEIRLALLAAHRDKPFSRHELQIP